MKKQKKIENWEKEFDKLWIGRQWTHDFAKSFIRQLLAQERQETKKEILKEIENYTPSEYQIQDCFDRCDDGELEKYNECLFKEVSQIIKRIIENL